MTDCHNEFDCDRLSQWDPRFRGWVQIILCFQGGINRPAE